MYKSLLVWLLFAVPSQASQASQLRLAAQPYLVPILTPFFDEWFQEAGVTYEFELCSAARCIKLLETDSSINGDAARRIGFEDRVPRLTPVGLSYGGINVYAMNLNAKAWPPSSNDTIACTRGTFWCEAAFDKNNVVWTNSDEQAEKMLLRGKVAWVVKTTSSFQPPPIGGWAHIDSVEAFLFVDKKMKEEIKRLVDAQSRLINNSRWQKMQQEYFYEYFN